ncbi:MAG: DUF3179 domain-containing protein [Alphaproteobacteria bacterium]
MTLLLIGGAAAAPERWLFEWSKTDFDKRSVPLEEIIDGGPSKDGIRSIDAPKFVPVADETPIADSEPVIGLVLAGEARAYPLRYLMFHEIVNDVIGEVPVAVTFCPLCNSAIVFDRRVGGRVLEFGTTGKLRNSDLVMYDRQTESWWQQFLGEAIVGELTGTRLEILPARIESLARFRARAPKGSILKVEPRGFTPYGMNLYGGYDSRGIPPAYDGELPEGIPPMSRVVSIGDEAWSFDLLRREGKIVKGDLVIRWEAGQNSALDSAIISEGRDVGNVTVRRRKGDGWEDAVHDVSFAFVFHAFRPEGVIHK